MNSLAPAGAWARLGALACATTLTIGLAASVILQRQSRVPARSPEAAIEARLDAKLVRAIEQAYADHDLDLADSLERILILRTPRTDLD